MPVFAQTRICSFTIGAGVRNGGHGIRSDDTVGRAYTGMEDQGAISVHVCWEGASIPWSLLMRCCGWTANNIVTVGLSLSLIISYRFGKKRNEYEYFEIAKMPGLSLLPHVNAPRIALASAFTCLHIVSRLHQLGNVRRLCELHHFHTFSVTDRRRRRTRQVS